MTRLNSYIRAAILEKAIAKSSIKARADALKDRRIAFVEACRIDALGGKAQAAKLEKLGAKINKLIEDAGVSENIRRKSMFRTDYHIYLNIAGLSTNGYFGHGFSYAHKEVYKITPENHTIIGGTPLHEEFLAIEHEDGAILSDQADLRNGVRAMINSVTTIEKLIEVWPEAVELMPDTVKPAGSNLPAVLPENLNKLIGLPTEQLHS
jgi:hypothetical protein